MIQSVLISGHLDEARLYRALGELADIASVPNKICKPVIVIDSNGGNISALHGILESIANDPKTQTTVAKANVKIYSAQSAAAVIALSFGSRREMASSSVLGFHLPSITLSVGDIDLDNTITASKFGPCVKTEQMVLRLIDQFGLLFRKPELYASGWLHVTAQDCLIGGLVQELFSTGPDDSRKERSGRAGSVVAEGDQTILISGLLGAEVLDRATWELERAAAVSGAHEVVFLVDSPGGSVDDVVSFLEFLQQDEALRDIAERASVKIYDADSAAALLAFSLGCRHELYRHAKIAFHLGELELQMGNPAQIDSNGRVSPTIMERWNKCKTMVSNLVDRLGIARVCGLNDTLQACGRASVTPEQLLRCGAVSRLY